MAVKDVPSDHDFFDPAYVRQWTDNAMRNRPERRELFRAFSAETERIRKSTLSVLELGCGPGLLAEELLRIPRIVRYTLVDFSPPMLDLSRERLEKFRDRTVFRQVDFKKRKWTAKMEPGFDLIVSLQAVHELRHASRIPKLYTELYDLLVPGGTILIGDLVNSSLLSGRQAAHLMTTEQHIETFKEVGFLRARSVCSVAGLSLIAAKKPKQSA